MKASDVKKGNVVEHEGTVYQVRDIERSSPTARGGNVTFRFTLYSIPGARKFDLSLRADDDLKEMDLVRRPANFSYMDGEAYVFIDAEDYTQYMLDAVLVGDNSGYVVEGVEGYYVQLIDDAPEVILRLPAEFAPRPFVHVDAAHDRKHFPSSPRILGFVFRNVSAHHLRRIGVQQPQIPLAEGRRCADDVFAESD